MIQFEKLTQWLQWLEASHPTTDIELGLSRVSHVAKKLGLLEPKAPVVTVAGTNGKGSVIATLESLSNAQKLDIGSYTSPHLISFNERVKINGVSVSDEILCQAFAFIANNKGDVELTYFEFTTLVGLYCFAQQELDLIALEVGLGGRLDAVNIIDADVSVITSIGLDHTDWLGDTLEAIAYEKAGVARADKPLVVAELGLVSLLERAIEEKQPKLIVADRDYQLAMQNDCWSYQHKGLKIEKIKQSSLLVSNQAAALTAFSELFSERLDEGLIGSALTASQLVGRFSKLSQEPYIILDVAHNPDSAQLLNRNIKNLHLPHSAKVWAICGMLKDKDITNSLDHLTAIDHWLCIDLEPPRGAKSHEIIEVLEQLFSDVDKASYANVDTAYQFFAKNAMPNDLLVVFGSFVTVGQMLEYWHKV